MKILLVGYGKMGQVIEAIARQRGHHVVGVVDVTGDLTIANAPPADVAIEFTHPESAVENIRSCAARNLPVVVGTTGWIHRLPEVKALTAKNDATVFYSSNFSLGVNIFFKLNEHLARLINGLPGYAISIDETHHTQKKDAPSGTAITLAEGIIKNHLQKKKWRLDEAETPTDLVIRSHRVDPVPGTHVVSYESVIDSIEIRHTAHSREGFATGAVLVAEWILDKKGLLTMDDFLKIG